MPSLSPRAAASGGTISPRLLHSSQSSAAGGKRAELLTRYHVVQELDPWGRRVKDDVARYNEELKERQAQDRAKRERFRTTLAQQITEHAESKALDSTRKEAEMAMERALFQQFRREESAERAARREKHLHEIEERREHLTITSARREAELQRERDEENERRLRFERERAEVIAAEQRRRERQKEVSREAWESNLRIKALKERQRREEMERDKALMAEYIRITDEERRARQEFIKSRQRPTTRSIAATDAQREKEEKMARFVEAQLKQQEVEAQRLQLRHEDEQRKKRAAQVEAEAVLRAQMEERQRKRDAQRAAELAERRRLDDDTAEFQRREREAKERKWRRAVEYSGELESQMSTQRERGLLELITPPMKAH